MEHVFMLILDLKNIYYRAGISTIDPIVSEIFNNRIAWRPFLKMKVADINVLQTALFMYKLNLNIIPDKFQSLFTKNNQIHTHHTRNANKYHLSNPKTSLAHNSIIHKGPDVWNSLPKYITQCTTLISFKSSMKKYLMSSYR